MSQLPEVTPAGECDDFRVGIVAIGGAGISILTHLKPHFPFPSRSIAIDLNQLPLGRSNADHTILVGNGQLNPKRSDRVRFLAKAAEAQIRQAVEGLHFVFLLCGLGGMAGSYITPFVADVLRRMNILTTAAVVMPFSFDSAPRHAVARKGLDSLRDRVAVVFALPGNFDEHKEGVALGLEEAIQQRRTAFGAIYCGICYPLLANQMPGLDFEDMSFILSQRGLASFRHVVVGKDIPLAQAARTVFVRSLKEHGLAFHPKGLFVSFKIHRGRPKQCQEMNEVMNVVKEYMSDDSSILFGSWPNPEEGEVEMTFVFVGSSGVALVNSSTSQ